MKKSTYMEMDKEERRLYLKFAKKLVLELEELYDNNSGSDDVDDTNSSDSEIEIREIASESEEIPNSNLQYITFVGMHYRGDHRFSSDDRVRLEKEDDNSKDSNAIMVKVRKRRKWVHVAYVSRRNAKWLRSADDFEKLPLSWIKNSQTTSTYSIDLGPLERKNTVIPTRISILNEIYWSQNAKTRPGKIFVNGDGKLDKHISLEDVIKNINFYGVVVHLVSICSSSYTAIHNILRPGMQYTVVAAGMSSYRGKQRWHFITYCGLRVREGKSFRRIWNEWRKKCGATQNGSVDGVEHMTFIATRRICTGGNGDMKCEIID